MSGVELHVSDQRSTKAGYPSTITTLQAVFATWDDDLCRQVGPRLRLQLIGVTLVRPQRESHRDLLVNVC